MHYRSDRQVSCIILLAFNLFFVSRLCSQEAGVITAQDQLRDFARKVIAATGPEDGLKSLNMIKFTCLVMKGTNILSHNHYLWKIKSGEFEIAYQEKETASEYLITLNLPVSETRTLMKPGQQISVSVPLLGYYTKGIVRKNGTILENADAGVLLKKAYDQAILDIFWCFASQKLLDPEIELIDLAEQVDGEKTSKILRFRNNHPSLQGDDTVYSLQVDPVTFLPGSWVLQISPETSLQFLWSEMQEVGPFKISSRRIGKNSGMLYWFPIINVQ